MTIAKRTTNTIVPILAPVPPPEAVRTFLRRLRSRIASDGWGWLLLRDLPACFAESPRLLSRGEATSRSASYGASQSVAPRPTPALRSTSRRGSLSRRPRVRISRLTESYMPLMPSRMRRTASRELPRSASERGGVLPRSRALEDWPRGGVLPRSRSVGGMPRGGVLPVRGRDGVPEERSP